MEGGEEKEERRGGGSTTFTAYSVYLMDIYTQAFKATIRAMRSILQLDCQSVLDNLNKNNSKAKAKNILFKQSNVHTPIFPKKKENGLPWKRFLFNFLPTGCSF